jgi:hypothetical protein
MLGAGLCLIGSFMRWLTVIKQLDGTPFVALSGRPGKWLALVGGALIVAAGLRQFLLARSEVITDR